MRYKRTGAAGSGPISLAEAKAQLNISQSFTSDDDLINAMIATARRYFERETGIVATTGVSTYEGYLDDFPPDSVQFPVAPVSGISAVEYIEPDASDYTALSSGTYEHDVISHPARIRPLSTESWPSTEDRLNAVKITFTAGYGNADDVPEEVKHAIKMILTHLYVNRGDDGLKTIPRAVTDMINQVKMYLIG